MIYWEITNYRQTCDITLSYDITTILGFKKLSFVGDIQVLEDVDSNDSAFFTFPIN